MQKKLDAIHAWTVSKMVLLTTLSDTSATAPAPDAGSEAMISETTSIFSAMDFSEVDDESNTHVRQLMQVGNIVLDSEADSTLIWSNIRKRFIDRMNKNNPSYAAASTTSAAASTISAAAVFFFIELNEETNEEEIKSYSGLKDRMSVRFSLFRKKPCTFQETVSTALRNISLFCVGNEDMFQILPWTAILSTKRSTIQVMHRDYASCC